MIEEIFKEMRKLQEEMNRIFSNFDRELKRSEYSFREPLTDLRDEEDSIVAAIELPGVDKRDIKINVTEESLEIKVEKKEEAKIKGKNYIKEERAYKGFYRKITLPEKIIPDKVKANYKDGILEVIMPKQQKEKKRVATVKVE